MIELDVLSMRSGSGLSATVRASVSTMVSFGVSTMVSSGVSKRVRAGVSMTVRSELSTRVGSGGCTSMSSSLKAGPGAGMSWGLLAAVSPSSSPSPSSSSTVLMEDEEGGGDRFLPAPLKVARQPIPIDRQPPAHVSRTRSIHVTEQRLKGNARLFDV